MTDLEAAWLAGLLEGEGSFACYLDKRPGRVRGDLRIALRMTDEDVVRHAAAVMETAKVRGPYDFQDRLRRIKSRKPIFEVTKHGPPAERIMQRILPYMGERRTAKIKELLAMYEERTVRFREQHLPPTCHPAAKRGALGLCRPCYIRQWNARRSEGRLAEALLAA